MIIKVYERYDYLEVEFYNTYTYFSVPYKDIDKVIEQMLKVKEKLKRHVEHCK